MEDELKKMDDATLQDFAEQISLQHSSTLQSLTTQYHALVEQENWRFWEVYSLIQTEKTARRVKQLLGDLASQ